MLINFRNATRPQTPLFRQGGRGTGDRTGTGLGITCTSLLTLLIYGPMRTDSDESAMNSPYIGDSQRIPELHFSATQGEEPEVDVALV
jgi:hypothetical protein